MVTVCVPLCHWPLHTFQMHKIAMEHVEQWKVYITSFSYTCTWRLHADILTHIHTHTGMYSIYITCTPPHSLCALSWCYINSVLTWNKCNWQHTTLTSNLKTKAESYIHSTTYCSAFSVGSKGKLFVLMNVWFMQDATAMSQVRSNYLVTRSSYPNAKDQY